jgi:hypothetical protein
LIRIGASRSFVNASSFPREEGALINLISNIPKGLNAEEFERFLRANGAVVFDTQRVGK